jgi:hypothetical protein
MDSPYGESSGLVLRRGFDAVSALDRAFFFASIGLAKFAGPN